MAAVSSSAAGDLLLDSGASIAANAGAVLSANNTLTGGKGGAIDLKAAFPATAVTLSLDADLSARGFGQNGSLSVNVPELQIGKGESVQPLKMLRCLIMTFCARRFWQIQLYHQLRWSGYSASNRR